MPKAFFSYRNNSASPAKPSLPHALSQFHLFATNSSHSVPLSCLLRQGLAEGFTTTLLHSTAVFSRVLQMMPVSL